MEEDERQALLERISELTSENTALRASKGGNGVGLDTINVRGMSALSQVANFQSTMFIRLVSEGDPLTASSCRNHKRSVLVSSKV